MKRVSAILLVFSIFAVTIPAPQAQTTPSSRRYVTGVNRFGLNLFDQLRRKDPAKNIFYSPLSVSLALAMAYTGAAGSTQREMATTLGVEGLTTNDAASESASLLNRLKSVDPKVELVIANSLWGRKGVAFKDEFLALNRRFFGAELSTLDFSSPQAKTTINNWVSRNTRDRIPSIVDQINAQHVLFLLNAVYFKGQWQTQFDKSTTKSGAFYMDGKEKQLPFMARSGNYAYFRGDKFQGVELPYGSGAGETYAIFFLPDVGTSLDEFLKGLTYEKWSEWTNSFRRATGEVRLPRFKLDFTATLNDPLKALGMDAAFDPSRADFSGMRTQHDLYISEVKHKAVVDVSEEGTEAAAATSVGFSATSAQVNPQPPFSFIANRPFLMTIQDRQTGALLFIGAVMEPMESK